MSLATWDSSFHFASSGRSYLSMSLICDLFDPMEAFFDGGETKPTPEFMYAMYLVCKKAACTLMHTDCKLLPADIPAALESSNRWLPRFFGTAAAAAGPTPADRLALAAMLADEYQHVHITVAQKFEESRRRMEYFTLDKNSLHSVAERLADYSRAEAFCMGLHPRLGAGSMVRSCLGTDLATMVCSHLLR